VIPAAIEFVDIAGLVAGASKGEGLGNQFLANIREVDAIIHVVRCFEDSDVIHTMGGSIPVRDIEVITTELVLADLDAVAKRLEKVGQEARSGDKEAQAEVALLERLSPHLNANKPANLLTVNDEETKLMRLFQLLTAKPVLYACNVAESDLANAEANPFVQQVAEFVRDPPRRGLRADQRQIEAELIDLEPAEAKAFLKDSGRRGLRRVRVHPRVLRPARDCRPISPPAKRRCAPGRSRRAGRPRRRPGSSTPTSRKASSRRRSSPTGPVLPRQRRGRARCRQVPARRQGVRVSGRRRGAVPVRQLTASAGAEATDPSMLASARPAPVHGHSDAPRATGAPRLDRDRSVGHRTPFGTTSTPSRITTPCAYTPSSLPSALSETLSPMRAFLSMIAPLMWQLRPIPRCGRPASRFAFSSSSVS
jgi:hypothetical protein